MPTSCMMLANDYTYIPENLLMIFELITMIKKGLITSNMILT